MGENMTAFDDELRVIGKRVTHVRKQRSMTQAMLAEKAGVSLKFMSMLEGGSNASMKTLLTVSEALGMDLKDLLRSDLKGKGKRFKSIVFDEKLQDPSSKELLRILALLDNKRRKKALKILKMAFAD
jgi:transcriptional regulator with XRE-family HTH domain